MKTGLIFAGLCLLAGTRLHATPDHHITVEERFAGSNASTYAVLRTETDNLSSYYESLRKVFLDERSKDGKTTVKSTLLLDEKRTRDAGHADPKTPAPVTVEIHSKDDSISMAAILEKFPVQAPRPWTEEELKRLRISKSEGIFFDRILLAGAERITKDAFGGWESEEEWQLVDVADGFNSTFLRLSKGAESGRREIRVICVDSETTAQVRTQFPPRDELYLLAGTYDTQDAAISQARKWIKEHHLHLEVWTLPDVNRPSRVAAYVIVDTEGLEKIRRLQSKSLSNSLGVEVEPIFGTALGTRIDISE